MKASASQRVENRFLKGSEGKANRLACLPTKAVLIDWSCLWLFLGPMEELDVFVLGTPYPLSITYTFPPQGNGTRLYASKELELEVVGVIALHDTEHHFLKSSVSGNNCKLFENHFGSFENYPTSFASYSYSHHLL
ncbi:hypothetical protein Tco_0669033 [Tanacetum coccineum]